MNDHKTLGIYIHIPFCRSKCQYCDFYSLGGSRDRKLVDGSGYCVSYCNRPNTGTAYTVKYAMKRGVKVLNASSFDLRNL